MANIAHKKRKISNDCNISALCDSINKALSFLCSEHVPITADNDKQSQQIITNTTNKIATNLKQLQEHKLATHRFVKALSETLNDNEGQIDVIIAHHPDFYDEEPVHIVKQICDNSAKTKQRIMNLIGEKDSIISHQQNTVNQLRKEIKEQKEKLDNIELNQAMEVEDDDVVLVTVADKTFLANRSEVELVKTGARKEHRIVSISLPNYGSKIAKLLSPSPTEPMIEEIMALGGKDKKGRKVQTDCPGQTASIWSVHIHARGIATQPVRNTRGQQIDTTQSVPWGDDVMHELELDCGVKYPLMSIHFVMKPAKSTVSGGISLSACFGDASGVEFSSSTARILYKHDDGVTTINGRLDDKVFRAFDSNSYGLSWGHGTVSNQAAMGGMHTVTTIICFKPVGWNQIYPSIKEDDVWIRYIQRKVKQENLRSSAKKQEKIGWWNNYNM
eukprot:85804_1